MYLTKQTSSPAIFMYFSSRHSLPQANLPAVSHVGQNLTCNWATNYVRPAWGATDDGCLVRRSITSSVSLRQSQFNAVSKLQTHDRRKLGIDGVFLNAIVDCMQSPNSLCWKTQRGQSVLSKVSPLFFLCPLENCGCAKVKPKQVSSSSFQNHRLFTVQVHHVLPFFFAGNEI